MCIAFTFELNDNKIVKIETPKDGNEYTSSIKEMYPDDIENKVNTKNINSIDNTNQKSSCGSGKKYKQCCGK